MSEKAKVVLHIPSMAALEDIVGKMEDAGLSVKAAIVQEFASKHLKDVVNQLNVEPLVAAVMKDLDKHVKSCAVAAMKEHGVDVDPNGNRWGVPLVKSLAPQLEARIGTMVLHKLNDAIATIVQSAVDSVDESKLIDIAVKRFEEQVGRSLESHLQDRLTKAMSLIVGASPDRDERF